MGWRAMNDAERGLDCGARTHVSQRFSVTWAPGLLISEFWGSLRSDPEQFELEVDRLVFTLGNAMHELEGPFVSLIDASAVTEVTQRWIPRMARIFRSLPRPPTTRAFVGAPSQFGTVQAGVIRAATLGRVRVFSPEERATVCEWLAEARTCSASEIERLWGRR